MLKRFKFPGWKRVLMFTALVCALPLVPEALLLVDVVGLEATFVFWATGSLVFAVCTLGPAILSQV